MGWEGEICKGMEMDKPTLQNEWKTLGCCPGDAGSATAHMKWDTFPPRRPSLGVSRTMKDCSEWVARKEVIDNGGSWCNMVGQDRGD